MGGPNLEVFKFGLYIMFPIGIMYYFGTNLDNKFSVPGFWPSPNQLHKIPYERQEIDAELERLKARRLALRQKRLQEEAQTVPTRPDELEAVPSDPIALPQAGGSSWSRYLGGFWRNRE